ncbi:hypothetical protein HNR46_003087 [Haloferula luteola]|uniref:Uncharacterized protein n=1 Tax=Haloferula luteola TaxID=595692 RepID=A0A840VG92_9BACT|nr:hypothetical protein [Haloferula luteola]MBB5352839.1 hypothetical protein [Haloferula luteola]
MKSPLMKNWKAWIVLLALGVSPAASGETPNVVNIVNFIRGVEPRTPMDLVEPVRQQLALARKHQLPTTWLIQYDALIRPEFTDLLKKQMGPDDEIGAWLEVVQPQVEAAGLKWRGRFPWDWHVNVGFTQGYPVEQRKQLMDVYMAKFEEVFGFLPRSVGSWILDAPTLNYVHDRYGVETACNCKDQSGTDGYTLWGGYWNQAYYPSRMNAYMPAQGGELQLDVPVFRMLGSDPVHQYDHGVGGTWQGVVTLEPVYRPGGGDPSWVDWFFETNFRQPSLEFSYMQAGQENSFGWDAMKDGLIDQYAKLQKWRDRGEIRVETLAASGAWFRKQFPHTPATSVVAMEDAVGAPERSVWYESRFYRVNFAWSGDVWKIRDLHVFNERYPERYLEAKEDSSVATYDTLPVVDGFHWSEQGDLAAMAPFAGEMRLKSRGMPVVEKVGEESLRVSVGADDGGVWNIQCDPDQVRIELVESEQSENWGLDLRAAAKRKIPVASLDDHHIRYRHQGFEYGLDCGDSRVRQSEDGSSIRIENEGGVVTLRFDRGEGAKGASSH